MTVYLVLLLTAAIQTALVSSRFISLHDKTPELTTEGDTANYQSVELETYDESQGKQYLNSVNEKQKKTQVNSDDVRVANTLNSDDVASSQNSNDVESMLEEFLSSRIRRALPRRQRQHQTHVEYVRRRYPGKLNANKSTGSYHQIPSNRLRARAEEGFFYIPPRTGR